MAGRYAARQRSANEAASIWTPRPPASAETSRMTPLRQSTTVPNTSNSSALTCSTGYLPRHVSPTGNPFRGCATAPG